jgi:flavodoxin I
MEKIGLFFGPIGGNCNNVAIKIAEQIGNDKIDLTPIKYAKHTDIEKYDKIIFGISSIGKDAWDNEDVETDWDRFLPEFDKIDFSGKTIATFGLGNQITYPSHFAESLGFLAHELESKGVKLVGEFPTDGFDYQESHAINKNGNFYGLVVDEDNEKEKTDDRIKAWLPSIKNAFGF